MDPLSQGALGVAVAQAFAPRERVVVAGVLGGLAGLAPDLDVLVQASDDPLLFLTFHRQFSHVLVFIPLGALLCAGVAFPFVRRRLGFPAIYGYCLVGYASHGLLDAFTSYGTQLLWPASDVRVAWNQIAVVDPLFTVPLLGAVVAAMVWRSPRWARLGCVWALVVLSAGGVQRERAQAVALEVAANRGHTPTEALAKPSFGNGLVWKTLYEHAGRYYVDAVRLGFDPLVYPGVDVPRLVIERDLPWLEPDTRQARDLERFRWFSSDHLARDPADPNRVIDVRYSMVPNEIEALWGITFDPAADPDAHVEFFTSRTPTAEQRAALAGMLRGIGGEGSDRGD